MKSVIKLIACAGFFWGTNFGMQKELIKRRDSKIKLYGESNSNTFQEQRAKDTTEDDACNERCLKSCERCCISALLPMGTAVVLVSLRAYQAITG